MLAKLMLTLESPMERLEKRHPVFFMVFFQFITSLALVIAVGGTALAGGLLIWIFYKLTGIM